MPGRRTSSLRGVKPVRRTHTASKKRSAAATARSRALTTLEKAKTTANTRTSGFMGIENKFLDFSYLSRSLFTVWTGAELDPATIGTFSVPVQGDGENERNGRTYTVNQVMVTGFINLPNQVVKATPVNDVIVRLVLVWDTQSNGAQLNAEDVFIAGPVVNAYRDLSNTKRFIILVDKTIRLSSGKSSQPVGALFANGLLKEPFFLSKTFTKNPVKVRCTATTGVIAACADNSFHLIGTTTNAAAKLDAAFRIRFTG